MLEPAPHLLPAKPPPKTQNEPSPPPPRRGKPTMVPPPRPPGGGIDKYDFYYWLGCQILGTCGSARSPPSLKP